MVTVSGLIRIIPDPNKQADKIIILPILVNDLKRNMSSYVADRIVQPMLEHRINVLGAVKLVLGSPLRKLSRRNSKVFDLITCALTRFHCIVDVLDPIIDPDVVADGNPHCS